MCFTILLNKSSFLSFKIILFYFRGDVIPLLLPSICKTEIFRSLLPYINLSKFENDSDTLMGFKVLSNLNIKYMQQELIFIRVYENHQRYHSFKIPTQYLSFIYEKIFHEINLLMHLWYVVIISRLFILKKIFFR